MKSYTLSRGLLVVIFLLTSFFCHSKPPIKYGKVSIDELKMSTCSFDSTAPAIILCDYAEFDPTNLQYYRLMRIKILNKEGLDLASQVFQGNDIRGIKGKTYNLVGNKVETEKLKSQSVFKERVTDNFYRYRIAMPNVKVGSVFDIYYFDSGLPEKWNFQTTIPTKWSELLLPPSEYIDFRKSYLGYVTLKLSTNEHWIAENVPAFKKEPFVASYKNFMATMVIDLLRITIPGQLYKEYTTDWNSVAKLINEDVYFGQLIGPSGYLKELEQSIRAKCQSPYEMAKLAYDTIHYFVKWDETESVVSNHNTLRMCFNDEGNSTTINLILLNLLRRLDIETYPVVLSTRENGYLPSYFPSLKKLNYTIIAAKINDETILLDGTEKLLPFGYLPEKCLNGYGQLINEETATNIKLTTKGSEREQNILRINLNDDLSLNTEYAQILHDYSAFDFRKEYNSFNSKEQFITDYESENSGITINEFTISNLDSIYNSVRNQIDITAQNYAYDLGNEIMINPWLHLQLRENPFKIDERKYPIEIPFPINQSYSITFTVPDGYEVSETPSNTKIALPEKGGNYYQQTTVFDNIVTINGILRLNKTLYLPSEYPYMKQFYDIIVKQQAEPIILKKI